MGRGAGVGNTLGLRVFALLSVVALVVLASGQARPQPKAQPSQETLQQRAKGYYAALEKADFETAWTFFDRTMKRDNPKEEYVKNLQTSIKQIKVLSGPKVLWVEAFPAGGRPQPVGKAEAIVSVWNSEGAAIPTAKHVTRWLWEPSASK